MVKVIFYCIVLIRLLEAETLEQACFSCHRIQKVPSELIYRRYLLRYSTAPAIEKALIRYLKNPQKEHSIMPQEFFMKFPIKKAMKRDEKVLRKDIKRYLDSFDIKKKLILRP